MWFYFRQETLPVLVPWLALRAVADGVAAFAAVKGMGPLAQWSEIGVSVLFFFALLYLFPLWIALTLGAIPLEPGALRGRIERLIDRTAARFRNVLLWRTGGARVLNAAVVGVVPATRFCILSDTLLETLPPDETEAVVAHELGHVIGRHLPVYLAFVFLFMGISVAIFAAVPADLAENYLFSLPVLAVLTLVFWPGIFGMVNRVMEDEADLYSAELVGDPEPLIRALSRMAASVGSGRASGSWRHRNVDERVGRVRTLAANPRAAALFHKRVRVLRWSVALAAAAAVILSVHVSLPAVWTRDAGLELARAAAEGDTENPDAWTLYGKVLIRRGMVFEAEKAFLQALEADPGRRDVRDFLRAMPGAKGATLARMAEIFISAGWFDDAHRIAADLRSSGDTASALLVEAELALTPGSRAIPNPYHDPASAERLSREFLAAGRSVKAYAILVRSLACQGRLPDASEALAEARRHFPDDVSLRKLADTLYNRN